MLKRKLISLGALLVISTSFWATPTQAMSIAPMYHYDFENIPVGTDLWDESVDYWSRSNTNKRYSPEVIANPNGSGNILRIRQVTAPSDAQHYIRLTPPGGPIGNGVVELSFRFSLPAEFTENGVTYNAADGEKTFYITTSCEGKLINFTGITSTGPRIYWQYSEGTTIKTEQAPIERGIWYQSKMIMDDIRDRLQYTLLDDNGNTLFTSPWLTPRSPDGNAAFAYLEFSPLRNSSNCALYIDDIIVGKASYEDLIQSELDAINLDQVANANVWLPLTGSEDWYNFSWESSDESVITNTGEVNRALTDNTAVLTASMTYGGVTVTKDFPITVKGAIVFDELNAVKDGPNKKMVELTISYENASTVLPPEADVTLVATLVDLDSDEVIDIDYVAGKVSKGSSINLTAEVPTDNMNGKELRYYIWDTWLSILSYRPVRIQ